MEKPEKLFENGPEWEGYESESGPAFEVTIHETDHQLLPCADGKCWGDENCYDSVGEALDAIRTRIIAHRDELNRITGAYLKSDYESWPCPSCGRHRVQRPGTYRPEFSTPEDEDELATLPECEKCNWRPYAASSHAPPPSDLTRAQELLRAWGEAADNGRLRIAFIKWWPSNGGHYYVHLEWYPETYPRVSTNSADTADPNPLAAVRAAISATPWADVENK